MLQSGVKFGTSGIRGLVSDMTDKVCYAYTTAFIQHLEDICELSGRGLIAVGGDLRTSTERIMKVVARAVEDKGYTPESCGRLPSPAMAYYGLVKKVPAVMVTGSHIPDDRNGIKYTKKEGEILKQDEAAVMRQRVMLPKGLFNERGMFSAKVRSLVPHAEAVDLYQSRYLEFFPKDCLKGYKIGVYQHSAVGRYLMVKILSGLGADVTPLGISDTFISVDTEAIRPEDVESARQWASEYNFDSIVSTDGDSDRPLISDENGRWLRGDVAGILCAAYLEADAIVAPISCNSAAHKCGLFKKVYYTKIGSPYVIEGMRQAQKEGFKRVVGYEANGGFLLASDIECRGKTLSALPTRDAVVLLIAVLLLSIEKNKSISELIKELPARFTFSNRLKNFPIEKSRRKIIELHSGDEKKDKQTLRDVFGSYFGDVAAVDTTDGLRITFSNGEIVHLRPSGNAPEFRCYTEADTESRAIEMNNICMNIMNA